MKVSTFLSFEQFVKLAWEAPVISVDTEGYIDDSIWGVSIAFRTNPAGLVSDYFAFDHVEGNITEEQKEVLRDLIKNHPIITVHHAKHDLRAFEKLGIFRTLKVFDTMILAHMVDENIPNKSLDYLSKMFGGTEKAMPPGMKEIISGLGWRYVPLVMMRDYGARDAVATLELFEKLIDLFAKENFPKGLWTYEEKFLRIMKKAEDYGILIDQDFIKAKIELGEQRLEYVKGELDCDPGKRKELQYLLLDVLGLEVKKRSDKTGAPSFDKTVMAEYDEILEYQNSPVAKLVFEYRGWVTALGLSYRKYLELVKPDGRLHPNHKHHGTRSSRLSCEAPNTQQIPKTSQKPWNGDMKKSFIPAPGYALVDCDYSNLELRLAAVYAKDPNLFALFEDPNVNPFRRMSTDLGWEYDKTKTYVYASMYGVGIRKLTTILGCSFAEAKRYREQFSMMYPGLIRLMERCTKVAEKTGEITYWSGRKRHLPGKTPKDMPRLAFNSLLQGGGAEIVKRAIIRVDDAGLNNDDCHIVLQVHDSIVLEVREELVDDYVPKILTIMEDVASEDERLGTVQWIVKSKPWGSE